MHKRILTSSPEHCMAPAVSPSSGGKVNVEIVSASDLRASDWTPGSSSDPYCTCEIPGKPHSKIQTSAMQNTTNPTWNHKATIAEYTAGEHLEFTVLDQGRGKKDDILGKAVLNNAQFHKVGEFDGDLPLSHGGGFLRVKVEPLQICTDISLFTRHWVVTGKGRGGMRNDTSGEVGFAFLAKTAVLVTALGRQLSPGQNELSGQVRVTLWCSDTKAALVSVCIGPDSSVEDRYAYTALQGDHVRLERGKEYRLSQQCTDGMPDVWFDGVVEPGELESGSSVDYAEFRGSVSGDGDGFPSRNDIDDRLPRERRRAGMLNLKMKVATSAHKGQQLSKAAMYNLGMSEAMPRTERPERLAIRFVCMSPSP